MKPKFVRLANRQKMTNSADLATAYAYCLRLANSHYENFPVASFLLPARLRKAVSVIYAFARTADDIADEGDATETERLAALSEYEHQLTLIDQARTQHENYHSESAIFIALNDVIEQYALPVTLFEDLLSAFQQDVTQKRYQTDNEVADYCRRSANPIGRLLLQLHSQPNSLQLKQSDAICTALQLVNFYQDIQQDLYENDRLYLPLADFVKVRLSEECLFESKSTKLAPIIRDKYKNIHTLFSDGFALGFQLQGRFGWEIRTVTLTGIATLRLLSLQEDDDLYSRPRLSKFQIFTQAILALLPNVYRYYSQSSLKKISLA